VDILPTMLWLVGAALRVCSPYDSYFNPDFPYGWIVYYYDERIEEDDI